MFFKENIGNYIGIAIVAALLVFIFARFDDIVITLQTILYNL